jgi:chaperonin cofactor prefoldin
MAAQTATEALQLRGVVPNDAFVTWHGDLIPGEINTEMRLKSLENSLSVTVSNQNKDRQKMDALDSNMAVSLNALDKRQKEDRRQLDGTIALAATVNTRLVLLEEQHKEVTARLDRAVTFDSGLDKHVADLYYGAHIRDKNDDNLRKDFEELETKVENLSLNSGAKIYKRVDELERRLTALTQMLRAAANHGDKP